MKTRALSLLASLVLLLAGCETAPTRSYPTEADPAKAARIHSVLERWVEVQGGRGRLKKLQGWQTESVMELAAGKSKFPCKNWQTADGEYRMEITAPGKGVLIEGYDGRVGWRANEQLGFGLVPPAELDATRRRIAAHHPLDAERTHPGRRLLPEETIAERRCDVIEMTGTDGVAEKWFFDTATGQLVREERPGPPGQPGVVVEYSDFRAVDGYTTAFLVSRTDRTGQAVFRVQAARTNPSFSPGQFSPPPGSVENNNRVSEILRQYLKAMGGAEAHARIRSRVLRSEVDVTSAGIKSHMTLSIKRPNLVLQEQEMPGVGQIVQGFDGTTAWAYSEVQGYRVLQGAERQQLINAGNLMETVHLEENYPLRKFLGEKTVGDRRTQVVALATMQGSAGLHYFDIENGRLLRVETQFVAGPKGMLKATVDLSDFRFVDGVLIPFRSRIENPAMQITITVESVRNNVELDDALFRPRKGD